MTCIGKTKTGVYLLLGATDQAPARRVVTLDRDRARDQVVISIGRPGSPGFLISAAVPESEWQQLVETFDKVRPDSGDPNGPS